MILAALTWGGVMAVGLVREVGCDPGWCGSGVVAGQVVVAVGGVLAVRWWLRLVWSPGSSSGWFATLPWLTAIMWGFLAYVLAAVALVGALVLSHPPG